jgi:hypothetical protein
MYAKAIAIIAIIVVLFFLTRREKYEPPAKSEDDVLKQELSVCGDNNECIIQVLKQAGRRNSVKKNM